MPSRVPVLYQDRDSVIHRRDARVKIVLFGLLLRSGLDKFDFGMLPYSSVVLRSSNSLRARGLACSRSFRSSANRPGELVLFSPYFSYPQWLLHYA
jgi:hypothetical protein